MKFASSLSAFFEFWRAGVSTWRSNANHIILIQNNSCLFCLITVIKTTADASIMSRAFACIADVLGLKAENQGGLRSGPAANSLWNKGLTLLEVTSKNSPILFLYFISFNFLKLSVTLEYFHFYFDIWAGPKELIWIFEEVLNTVCFISHFFTICCFTAQKLNLIKA